MASTNGGIIGVDNIPVDNGQAEVIQHLILVVLLQQPHKQLQLNI